MLPLANWLPAARLALALATARYPGCLDPLTPPVALVFQCCFGCYSRVGKRRAPLPSPPAIPRPAHRRCARGLAPSCEPCERPVGRWRAVGATGSWMPVPGSLDPLTSTTEELCGCLGRGSTGPSSRRAGRGPGHKTRVAAPAGEPGASHKGRLGGRLRQQWQKQACRGRRQALSRWTGIAPECSCGARAALAAVPSAGSVLE